MCCEAHTNRWANPARNYVTSRVLTDDLRQLSRIQYQRAWGGAPITVVFGVTWSPVRTPATVEATAPEVAEPVLV